MYYYFYLVVDIFSRKAVGAAVHETESSEHAAEMMEQACAAEGIDADQLKLHSDNGSPMKGATLLATLQKLGVVPSFSRPHVSDDNPFSEALFRTAKYRPEYPHGSFASLKAAREWSVSFVDWYNEDHLHSAIRFVTPAQRHSGQDIEILEEKRPAVYEAARARHPERWSRNTRDWSRPGPVHLNPQRTHAASEAA
jgi:transposase InsO family protein